MKLRKLPLSNKLTVERRDEACSIWSRRTTKDLYRGQVIAAGIMPKWEQYCQRQLRVSDVECWANETSLASSILGYWGPVKNST